MVLELTAQGESKQNDGSLSGILRHLLKVPDDYPVFIPSATYMSGGNEVHVHLMEGYAFVASGLIESRYFKLEDTFYVRRVMTRKGTHGMRILSCVPDSDIKQLRFQLQQQVASDIEEGMSVDIVDGPYRSLTGKVQEVLSLDDAVVRVEMRSLDLFTKVPRNFLTPSKEDV